MKIKEGGGFSGGCGAGDRQEPGGVGGVEAPWWCRRWEEPGAAGTLETIGRGGTMAERHG